MFNILVFIFGKQQKIPPYTISYKQAATEYCYVFNVNSWPSIIVNLINQIEN